MSTRSQPRRAVKRPPPRRSVAEEPSAVPSPPPPPPPPPTPPVEVVEIDDDEVELLPSSSQFPSSSRSRRSPPVTVIIDDDVEDNQSQTGDTSEESVTILSGNNNNKRGRILPEGSNSKCSCRKRKNVASPKAPEKVILEEPNFSCPICMSLLVDASSTICGHIFCQSCIRTSIQARRKCPICTRKLTMNNFHRVYFPSAD